MDMTKKMIILADSRPNKYEAKEVVYGRSGVVCDPTQHGWCFCTDDVFACFPASEEDKEGRGNARSMQVGHQVVTIGGISGKIVNIKDDEVTVETGVEKAKINLKKWAVKEVIKPIES